MFRRGVGEMCPRTTRQKKGTEIERHTFNVDFSNNTIEGERRDEACWPQDMKWMSTHERRDIPVMPNDLIICSAFQHQNVSSM